MSVATTSAATTGASLNSSSYRIKFRRAEFLEMLNTAKPPRIYRVSNFYYFAFDGFIMYCSECKEDDLMGYPIIRAIEFSNTQWQKT